MTLAPAELVKIRLAEYTFSSSRRPNRPMSNIDICATHTMTREQAQEAADSLAADLARKFDIDYGWDEDTIVFERTGVSGEISVGNDEIRIHAQLGFLLMVLKGRIEEEIRRYLVEHFGCTIKP